MTQTFKDKIPKKTSVVFFKFDDDELPWKRAYHWTYDAFCKRGYFNIKCDCTPYPISEKTEYHKEISFRFVKINLTNERRFVKSFLKIFFVIFSIITKKLINAVNKVIKPTNNQSKNDCLTSEHPSPHTSYKCRQSKPTT